VEESDGVGTSVRLHLLGLPHTITNIDHSHCAFTGKVLRFPSMMRNLGYEIVHYGVEGAETEADEQVTVMSRAEQVALLGHDGSDAARFYSDDARVDSPLYLEFNKRLRRVLLERVLMSDLVLLPFGHAHHTALDGLSYKLVECGIGYPTLYDRAPFKIFESSAWMHYHIGRENRPPRNYEWVIPNYFDVNEWNFQPEPISDLVVFLGRIGEDKGLSVITEIAKRRPDLRFIICGQGDPSPYVAPNVTYLPPIAGSVRSVLLGSARCVLMPTTFAEPFGGVSVEAQLCGTPVLSSHHGAFAETIEDERTGFRCHTLGDFMAALDRTLELDRSYVSNRARRLFGYERVGRLYDAAFQAIGDLDDEGWYSMRSMFSQPLGPRLVPERHGAAMQLLPRVDVGELRSA
jgi:glycosyltransferase involved in cell wall biosynthesis